ncbi:ABC transporter permease [Candidatus Cardinium hertigii]|uniref:Dipeptide transport system permease protein DppC n=1 Tax=Candidatus Cardinium hertigii TaxID=247481 RepID=A0A2Z3LCR4_9BACT|nr:Dipeptide transport system permease protein DppC [Candidatus Cardinium hertigii]
MHYLSQHSQFKKLLIALLRKRLSCFCLCILLGYLLVTVWVKAGWLYPNWDTIVGTSHEPPSWTHCFGTDILGYSVLAKVIHGVAVAMHVGCMVALFATAIGVVLGIVAGYFGGTIDECVVWLYTVVGSIPTLLSLIVVAFIMGRGIQSCCIALVVVGWTDICRLIRGEVMRHRSREYIQAAAAIGAGNFRKLFIHILPNILSLITYQFSLTFQFAIKYEVILSYLGLGVQHKPSWGLMIGEAKTELLKDVWWGLFFPVVAMFLLLFAVNMLADALRDELDPKLRS